MREQLAAAYAAGALAPALRLLVETQCELSDAARLEICAADALAVTFFESEEPAPMRPAALEEVFARIAAAPAPRPSRQDAFRTAARRASGVIDEILQLPRTVHEPALSSIGAGGWTFAGPGIRTLKLDLDGDETAEIVRIEPGWGAPRHSHKGGEFTLVLAGAFSDARGRYKVGDIAVAGPGVTHRPIADAGTVCYSLAVTEAPLAFTGPLGFIQKMWRH